VILNEIVEPSLADVFEGIMVRIGPEEEARVFELDRFLKKSIPKTKVVASTIIMINIFLILLF